MESTNVLNLANRLIALLPYENSWELKVNGESYKVQARLYNISSSQTWKAFNLITINYDLIKFSDEFNFFDFNSKHKLTAFPTRSGEQKINTDTGKWSRDGRIEVRPSKLINLISPCFLFRHESGFDIRHEDLSNDDSFKSLWPKLVNQVIELFSAKIRSQNIPLTFNVSSDVESVYDIPNNKNENIGILQNSCMRHHSGHKCGNFAGFYNTIRGLRVIYQKKDDTLLFRVLLWYAKINGKNGFFLDRPYCNEVTAQKLYELAEKRGWAYRTQTSNNIVFKGEDDCEVFVNVDYSSEDYGRNNGTPYLDTLYYYDGDSINNVSGDVDLQCCDGNAFNSGFECYGCGDNVSDDDVYYGIDDNPYCEHCYDQRFITCESCNEIEYRNDAYYVDTEGWFCDSCYHDRFAICDDCNEVTDIDSFNHVCGNNICDNCLDNYFVCDDCGEYESNNHLNHDDDGCYCDSCFEKKEEEVTNEC